MATRRRRPKAGPTNRRANTALAIGFGALVLLWWLWPSQHVTSDVEALARVIQSEIGHGSTKQQRHIAWTARNLANERGETIAAMVCAPCGPQKRGRPLSSRQTPTAAQRKLARSVVEAAQGRDPTGGATHFLNPRLQDRLAKSKRPGYRGNGYNKVRRRWQRRYGWQRYYRLGPTLEFWGPKKKRTKS